MKLATGLSEWCHVVHRLLPYEMRPGIGRLYRTRRRQIQWFNNASASERKAYVFQRIKALVEHANEHVPFYREFYLSHGFEPRRLRRFEDIVEIPVVTKAVLQAVPVNQRSSPRRERYLVNTGGSSGQPLEFFIEPTSIAHECAHMHAGWERCGFKHGDVRLVFSGRSNVRNGVEYDAARNQYNVDIYRSFGASCSALRKVVKRVPVRFLHGYPSALHEFACWCDKEGPDIVAHLRGTLKGILLGSEYASHAVRTNLERLFGARTISWYGHTERAILAHEKELWATYVPWQTYGFCEVCQDCESDAFRLIGTSYYNFASPLIRYDTGDLAANVEWQDGMVAAFRLECGRASEYIMDSDGKRISITGLLFGRHHGLFAEAAFIQLAQKQPGTATVLVVPRQAPPPNVDVLAKLFDSENVKIKFDFKVITKPIRTAGGKVLTVVTDARQQ